MTNYTFENHLKYTIGGREFGYRQSPTEKYEVKAGKVDWSYYKKSSWRDELIRTADCVLNELGDDLVLFLSGGTDSEIVLRNFLSIGFKPRCVVIEFKDGYNAEDVVEAEQITQELDVPLEKVLFDVKDFFMSGEAADFSQQIHCSQITYLMVYYHVRKLGFPSVMGGEQLLRKHATQHDAFWYHCFRENEDASAMRFSSKYNVPLINEWFSYTPEMMMYYLNDPEIRQLVNNQGKYQLKLASVSTKNDVLRRLYPEVRVKKKTHGFERLLGFNVETMELLGASLPLRLEPSLDGIPLTEFLQQCNTSN